MRFPWRISAVPAAYALAAVAAVGGLVLLGVHEDNKPADKPRIRPTSAPPTASPSPRPSPAPTFTVLVVPQTPVAGSLGSTPSRSPSPAPSRIHKPTPRPSRTSSPTPSPSCLASINALHHDICIEEPGRDIARHRPATSRLFALPARTLSRLSVALTAYVMWLRL